MANQENTAVPTQGAKAQSRAENMAYATQSVFFNLGANLFEAPINYYVQKGYAQHTEAYKTRGPFQRYGRWYHPLVGELVGDIGGGATLFLTSSLAPNATQGFIRAAGRLTHPITYRLGQMAFKDEFHEPDYQAKVEKWADFQDKNIARTFIVFVGNVATNVPTQKLLKNPSPAKVIFAGKALSSALTNSIMILARMKAPQVMKDLDESMGEKYFNGNGDQQKTKPAEGPQVAAQPASSPALYPAPYNQPVTFVSRVPAYQLPSSYVARVQPRELELAR